ncbi:MULTISPECIES: hypothetical protein [Flammeovirga]|uniref:Uncharacterized protein n=1 Tax=Flammeovirga agarivorans TaxID=2726742 RepID=A0A7X8SIJ8_9BACT|nr:MULTISPECIES: hypothetical protein [Flammeovirga]NLR90880.1 hypothetical protein [Flammeovirga agarivorans]
MDGGNMVYKILFILTLSTVFPMIGYYLDYRHKRNMFKGQKPENETNKENK